MIKFLRGRAIVVTSVTLAFVLGSATQATTLRKLSLDELVGHSDTIVVGKCEMDECVWLEKKIYTIATIRTTHLAKGQATVGETIQIYELGGSVQHPLPVKMIVPGAATLTQGEEMLLFLEKFGDKKQFHRVVGMAQGKLPVSTDAKTGEKFVHHGEPIKGVQWVDKSGKPVAPGAPDAREESAKVGSLDGFLGRIHKIKTDHEAKAKATPAAPGEKGGGK